MKILTHLLVLFLCISIPQTLSARWVGDKWVPDTPQDRAAQKKHEIKRRADYASEFEKGLLSKGMDVDVTATGPEKRTFTLKEARMNKPLVYKLTNEGNMLERLHSMGFTKAILTDGFYETWTFDLKKLFSSQKKK